MKSRFRLMCVLMVCFVLSACSAGRHTPELVGRRAPLVMLYTLDGEQVPLSVYRGKTVVVLFWAQWCSRSQRIIRELNTFARNNPSLATVVGINIDKADKLGDLKSLIAEAGLKSIDHHFSGNEIYDEAYVAFDIGEIPTVLVLNTEGLVVAQGHSIDTVQDYFKVYR